MSGIAEVHPDATLVPSKLELIASWLPHQPWFNGDAADLEKVARFRFVDPAGEVGMETILVKSGGVTYQVPLTYRAEAIDEGADYLLGTMEHSLLGTRYVYDATGDPDYLEELIRVIREADNEASLSSGEKTMAVEGSGASLVANSAGQVRLARVLDDDHKLPGRVVGNLTGTWTDGDTERTAVLATLH